MLIKMALINKDGSNNELNQTSGDRLQNRATTLSLQIDIEASIVKSQALM